MKDDCFITIEKRLQMWAEDNNENERFNTLWHGWNQNKRWLSQLLELTLPSFPTYSRHDESHCKNILQNIERILEKERIMQLSATDCFMLLHVAYVHDISMAITTQERIKIITSDEFINLVEELKNSTDVVMSKSAILFLEGIYKEDKDLKSITQREKAERIRLKFLRNVEIFQATILLLGEYERKTHGTNSAAKLRTLINDPEKLGTGFSISGIPMRIFYRIADCAELHTNWNLHDILNLPEEDSGYSLDKMHPRFIAVMLQLGDALDMDNDRFHLFAKDFIGISTLESNRHFDKHSSIRNLQINAKKIYIEANCPTQDSLRLVRNECDNLERLLEFASYHWADICPSGFEGCLPTLQSPKLLLNDKLIPGELVDAKFSISQEKAFTLLEGANVYDCNFPFIRELLQNAIDATKIQYWIDILHESSLAPNQVYQLKNINVFELSKSKISNNYSIKIELRLRKLNENNEYVEVEEKDFNNHILNNQIGVLMNIIDCGTGISDQDIINISNVGSSFSKQNKIIQNMPKFLIPTAEFGIGLQSVFLITNHIKAQTHTRNGHCYDIYFTNASKNGTGYINVEPIPQSFDNYRPYGTNFEVFISNKNRLSHLQCLEAWNGEDPFTKGYKEMTPFRHANELLNQILITIDDILGDTLFPVKVEVEKQQINGFSFAPMINRKLNFTLNNKKKVSSWFNQLGNHKDFNGNPFFIQKANDIYYFDFDTCKLYMWIDEIATSVTVSGKNLYSLFCEEKKENKTTIYYKGIRLLSIKFDSIDDIIEIIDIKGGLNRHELQLNRSNVTGEGAKYLNNTIFTTIRSKLYYILDELFLLDEFEEQVKNYFDKMNDIIQYNDIEENCEKMYTFIFIMLFYKIHTDIKHLEKIRRCDKLIKIMIKGYFNIVKNNQNRNWLNYFEKCFTLNVLEFNIDRNLNKDVDNGIYFMSLRPVTNTWFEFLLEENRYAVLSNKDLEKEDWQNAIVIFKLLEKKGTLDKWNYEYFKKYFDLSIVYDQGSQHILNTIYSRQNEKISNWILNSVPILAIESDILDRLRLNIIGIEYDKYIYFDRYLSEKIITKVVEKYREKKIERFAIPSMPEYSYLSIEKNDLPISTYPVFRGRLSHQKMMMMIAPIKSEEIVSVTENRKIMNNKYDQFILKIKNIFIDCFKQDSFLSQIEKKDIAYIDSIFAIITNMSDNLGENEWKHFFRKKDVSLVEYGKILLDKDIERKVIDTIKNTVYNFFSYFFEFINNSPKVRTPEEGLDMFLNDFRAYSEKNGLQDFISVIQFINLVDYRKYVTYIVDRSLVEKCFINVERLEMDIDFQNLITFLEEKNNFSIPRRSIVNQYKEWIRYFNNNAYKYYLSETILMTEIFNFYKVYIKG